MSVRVVALQASVSMTPTTEAALLPCRVRISRVRLSAWASPLSAVEDAIAIVATGRRVTAQSQSAHVTAGQGYSASSQVVRM